MSDVAAIVFDLSHVEKGIYPLSTLRVCADVHHDTFVHALGDAALQPHACANVAQVVFRLHAKAAYFTFNSAKINVLLSHNLLFHSGLTSSYLRP